jgi:hypothetical protein
MARHHEIKTFKIGATSFTTIKEVTTSTDGNPLYDSGDDDASETLVGSGMQRISFTLTMADAVQAEAMKSSAAANIIFNGLNALNAANVLGTLANAKIFNRSQRAMHNGVWMTTLSGRADSEVYTVVP